MITPKPLGKQMLCKHKVTYPESTQTLSCDRPQSHIGDHGAEDHFGMRDVYVTWQRYPADDRPTRSPS